MDRQSRAFREAGPADWAPDDLTPTLDPPTRSPAEWDAADWDAGRLGAKSLALARGALAERVLDPHAPDDDPHAYDELAEPARRATVPRGAGIWVPWLVDAARATGYPVIEVPGWQTRGHGAMRVLEGVVGHHTGTPASAGGDYPTRNVVTNGRSDLAGPLCNIGLGRSGTMYVVAAGCAWHAGASRHAGFTDLNDEYLGIEAESPGNAWTPQQRDAYPKLVGSLLKHMSRPATRYVSHRGCAVPSGRKDDPLGIDDGWMQAQATAWMAGGGVPPAPTPATGVATYTVAAGDTLYSIARRFGVSVAQLKSWNGLSSDVLTIGKVLRVSA